MWFYLISVFINIILLLIGWYIIDKIEEEYKITIGEALIFFFFCTFSIIGTMIFIGFFISYILEKWGNKILYRKSKSSN